MSKKTQRKCIRKGWFSSARSLMSWILSRLVATCFTSPMMTASLWSARDDIFTWINARATKPVRIRQKDLLKRVKGWKDNSGQVHKLEFFHYLKVGKWLNKFNQRKQLFMFLSNQKHYVGMIILWRINNVNTGCTGWSPRFGWCRQGSTFSWGC